MKPTLPRPESPIPSETPTGESSRECPTGLFRAFGSFGYFGYFGYFGSIGLAAAVGLGLFVGISGCQSSSGSMRATTFPPDLTYIPPERIRTSMWVLAAEIQRLEHLLEEPTESEKRSLPSEVSASLSRMRVAARALDKPGRSTQHPILNQHLGQFLERLDRARLAVDRDPPDYYLASSIAGSCFLCHGQTQGRASWQPDAR